MNLYTVKPTKKFQRDLKRVQKRGYDISLLTEVIKKLVQNEPLPDKYCDHRLSGELKDCRECHIQPDWLLMYEKDETTLYLYSMRTGTHGDLFGK